MNIALAKSKNFLKSRYGTLLCLFFLLLSTCFVYALFFRTGIFSGDDLQCHLAQCYDYYYGLKHGFISANSNHLIYGYLAGNMIESYAPFPHALVGLLAFLFEWAGMDILIAYKLVVIVGSFLGGVFMWRFLLKIKANPIAAIVGALFFIVYPYRPFHVMCRASFSEAIALDFLPLFFLGIASFLKSNPYAPIKKLPFFEIGLGVLFMIFSHSLTAFFGVILGALYLLANIKRIIPIVKTNKHVILYSCLTIIFVICLSLSYLYPLIYATSSGVYRLSDSSIIKTTVVDLLNEANKVFMFTGLRIFTVAGNSKGTTGINAVIYALFVYAFDIVFVFLGNGLLKKNQKLKRSWRYLADIVILGLGVAISAYRLEMILAYILFALLFISYQEADYRYEKNGPEPQKAEDEEEKRDRLINIAFFGVSAFLTLILIFVPAVWFFMPSFVRSVQFPFRFFIFFLFETSAFLSCLMSLIKKKEVEAGFGCILVSLCLIFNQASLEKGLVSQSDYITSFNETNCHGARDGGLQKEYVPISLLDENYVSAYGEASLCDEVRALLTADSYSNSPDDYLTPVALEGAIEDGSFKIEELNTPNITFSITLSEDSLVQMPQIYYTGYAVLSKSSEATSSLKAVNVDGLLSFSIAKGTYEIQISYPGSTTVQVGQALSYFVVSFLIYDAFCPLYRDKRKKKFALLAR